VCIWNADFAGGLLGLFGNPTTIGEASYATSDEVFTWNQLYTQTFSARDLKPNIIYTSSAKF
jgi:hypothetical protein